MRPEAFAHVCEGGAQKGGAQDLAVPCRAEGHAPDAQVGHTAAIAAGRMWTAVNLNGSSYFTHTGHHSRAVRAHWLSPRFQGAVLGLASMAWAAH
jgi:hypothetical protein